jgi:hypothetical protein
MAIYGFHHICFDKNGKDIFEDQFKTIYESGLYSASSIIFCSVLGNRNGYVLPNKYRVVFESKESLAYERPILEFMKNNSTTYIGKYWYIHTKGISHYRTKRQNNANDWRVYMEYFLIKKWRTCVRDLEQYDVAGVNYMNFPVAHFSGNFWWTKSSYIQKNDEKFNYKEYYETEYWLCKANPIGISYHDSKTDHYEQRYLPAMYEADYQMPFIFSPGLSNTICDTGYQSANLNFNNFEGIPTKIIRNANQQVFPK